MLLVILALPAHARGFTDSAGRVVELPEQVNTVFAAGPPAAILVYILKPEALSGWPRALRPEERDYIPSPFSTSPRPGGSPGAAARRISNACSGSGRI